MHCTARARHESVTTTIPKADKTHPSDVAPDLMEGDGSRAEWRWEKDLESGHAGAQSKGTCHDSVRDGTRIAKEPGHGWWSAILAIGFFVGMCAMELALEGAGTWYGHIDSLAAAVTLSQFAGCLLLPLAVASATSAR